MAKINRYECDLCGTPIANGMEHSITIKYPYKAADMGKEIIQRTPRRNRTIQLCEECFAERLKEFGLEEDQR